MAKEVGWLFVFGILILCNQLVESQVVYAVNAGGGDHVDAQGISYLADHLAVGIKSEYGKRQSIERALPQDNELYQTERWHDSSFAYEIPIRNDGDYVLVLKFAEVYFYAPNMKVFDVQLNDQHVVLHNLDIFKLVGHSTAHDELIPLSIKKGKLSVNGEYSTFDGYLKVEFVKGMADNPKICAFYLMKGVKEDVPTLPPLKLQLNTEDEDEEDEADEAVETKAAQDKQPPSKTRGRKQVKSGPPAADPYAEDSGSLIMPIMVAFGLFIPTLLCLCRL